MTRIFFSPVFHILVLFLTGFGTTSCNAEYIPGGGWPSLIVMDELHNGSIARLDYSHEKGRYFVVDGKFTTYAAGQERIEKRPESGSHALAKTTSLAFLEGSLYGVVPSYNMLVKLGSHLDVAGVGAFGPYTHAGSMEMNLGATEKALVFFHRGILMVFDKDLNKLAEVKVKNDQSTPETFITSGNKLYFFQVEELGPMGRGMSPGRGEPGSLAAPGGPEMSPEPANFGKPEGRSADSLAEPVAGPGCQVNPAVLARKGLVGIESRELRNDILIVADLSNPAKPALVRNELIPDPHPPSLMRFRGIDPERGQWLIVNGNGASSTIQLRSMEGMASITAEVPPPAEIVGMTELAPFYAAVRRDGKLFVLPILTENGSIAFGTGLDLGLTCNDDLSWESLHLKHHGSALFVIFRNRLWVAETAGGLGLLLPQVIAPDLGAQCRINRFVFASVFKPAPSKADPAKLEALLALGYYGPEQNLELQTQLDKLTRDDAWAIALLAQTLAKEGQAMNLHPRLIRTLGDLGPAAQPAMGAILDTTCNGNTIFGDLAPVAEALAKIDPDGGTLITELAAFEKRKGESSAPHVSKAILAGHPSGKAKMALGKYK